MQITALFLVVFAAGAWAQVPRRGVAGKDYPYLLGVQHGAANYTYRDDETGYYGGFFHDLIDAVCDAMEIKCKIVIDDWNNAVQGRPGGKASVLGQGNQNGWYAANIAAFPTVDRIHFAKFSMPFTETFPTSIYKRKDDSGAFGGGYDFSQGKIGFVSGWFTSPSCVNRCLKEHNEKEGGPYFGQITGYPLSSETVANEFLEFASLKQEFQNNTTLSGVLANAGFLKGVEIEEVIPCTCTLGGVAAIGRADNTFIDNMWNKGFDLIMRNGVYKKLCKEADEKYGVGSIPCLSSYDWSN